MNSPSSSDVAASSNYLVPLHQSQLEVYHEQATAPKKPLYTVLWYIVFKGNLDTQICLDVINNLPSLFDIFCVKFYFSTREPTCYFPGKVGLLNVGINSFEKNKNPKKEALDWIQSRFPYLLLKKSFKNQHEIKTQELRMSPLKSKEHYLNMYVTCKIPQLSSI